MFLLTEGTLFFLDLALNARTCNEKPSLSSVVQKWVDGVTAANESDDSADVAHTTTGASSTLCAPSPVYLSAMVGQTSSISGGCGVASGSTQHLVFSKIPFPADDEDTRETAMSHYNEASISACEMSCASDGDSGRCHPDLDAQLSQRQQEAPRGVKRKVDDADIVSDIESDANEDDDMDLEDPVPEDVAHFAKMVNSTDAKRGRTRTPFTTSVDVKSPPHKRVKHEDASLPWLSSPHGPALCSISAACMAQPQDRQRRRVDSEGYVIKNYSEYTTKDLPVPCDQRWSQSFISTAILWYSVQKNLWNVPKAELASALQRIFNVVYPDVKYRVTPAGSIFALTLQRIHEWRSSFGSSALAMMLHFFSTLDDADDVHAAAEFLVTDFRFLGANPDACEATEPFRSPFLIMLLATTHLGDVSACVDVPGWDTQAMVAGDGGESVVAIASAALERALTFFRDGTLDAKHVPAETARARRPDAPLPKTALDVLAGRDAPPALRFSSANWSGHTAAYRDAVRKRGTAFVRGTFGAAQAKRRRIVGAAGNDGESEAGAGMSVSAVPDPRALL